MRIQSLLGTINAGGGTGFAAPQRIFQGEVTSTSIQVAWWAPADGTVPDSYNAYLNGVNVAQGIVPIAFTPGTSTPFPRFRHTGLSPSTTYQVSCTAVTGASESPQCPPLSITTLAGASTPATAPTPPTDPSTYIPPYSLPVVVESASNTVWTATQATSATTGNAGSTNGFGLLSKGCGFSYALANANPGDIIVLSSGVTYTSGSATNAHAFNATNGSSSGYIYVISDQDPAYNSTGRLIPPLPNVTMQRHIVLFTAGGAVIAANSTTLTLNDPFTGRTGWHKIVFYSNNVSGLESTQALFTTGSTSVVWNAGLQAQCSGMFLVGLSPGVTPWDAGVPIGSGSVTNPAPVMPILQFTQQQAGFNGGGGLRISGTNYRFVGICITPIPSWITTANPFNQCVSLGGTGNVLDRCVIGRDNTASTRTYFARSVAQTGTNSVIRQCYLYGADTGPGGGDSHAIGWQVGGPACFEMNYLEGVSEVVIHGGNHCAENLTVHDSVIRYNWTHKPTVWQTLLTNVNPPNPTDFSISRRLKNHIEAKMCLRFEWYGNVLQNNAQLQASQGQGGRGFVMTPREQLNATTWRQVSSIVWSAANGGTATVSITTIGVMDWQNVTPNFSAVIAGCPVAAYNGTWVATSGTGQSFTIGPIPTNPGNAGAFGTAATQTGFALPTQAGGMWQNITDGNIHDNQEYGVASACALWSAIDYVPNLYSARVWYHDNFVWVNPAMTDDLTTKSIIRGFTIQGKPVDTKWYNNTLIMIPQTFGYSSTPGTPLMGIASEQGGSTNNLTDRWEVRDSFIDSTRAGSIENSGGGAGPPNQGAVGTNFLNFSFDMTTLVWNKNVVILDTNTWPATGSSTTYQPNGYANIGFASYPGNTVQPQSPADYNVVTGTYLTASTTGGPVGSTFLDTLSNDRFPRTLWMAISTNAPAYAGATFQTNAAKFNAVVVGPYAGIEQDMGTTFATVFGNIKSQSRANGLSTPTRCLHYTNAWAQALPAWSSTIAYVVGAEVISGGNRYICIVAHTNHVPPNASFWTLQGAVSGTGNGSTYTVWSNQVNAANWWLRDSYPSGAVVLSNFGGETTNTGVLAVTSQNNVTLNGATIYSAYWSHYDGLLRQGNGTTLGYAANKSLVTNPALDGYEMDNTFVQPRVTGAWQMNTTSFVSHWPNSADPTQSAWVQQAQLQHVAALRATNPNLILLGNTDYFVRSTTNFSYQVTLDPTQQGLWDMIFHESAIGNTTSIEGTATTTTAQFLQNLIAAEIQVAPGGVAVLGVDGQSRTTAWTSSNQASWVPADWQAARFAAAIACLRDEYLSFSNRGTYSPSQPYFMDETLAQGGKFGWLGHPTEAPQSAARTSGVWWRKFQNGVVFMNPAGNGTQTLTLSALGLSANLKAVASNGFGDATINTGLSVTSITLQARDGRFLIGVP